MNPRSLTNEPCEGVCLANPLGLAMHKHASIYLVAASCTLLINLGARAQDEVRFLNGKKQEERLQVTVKEESPAGIVYKLSSGRTDKLATKDILDITYQVPQGLRLDYRGAGGKEREADQPATKPDKRTKLLQEAQKEYQELIPKLADVKL